MKEFRYYPNEKEVLLAAIKTYLKIDKRAYAKLMDKYPSFHSDSLSPANMTYYSTLSVILDKPDTDNIIFPDVNESLDMLDEIFNDATLKAIYGKDN